MVDTSSQQYRLQRFRESVAQEVARLRELSAMSLRQLAEECGISHRALWEMEHARTDPRLSTLFLVAEALRVPVADLVSVQPLPGVQGDDDLAWLVRFNIPSEIADRVTDEIGQQIGGWLLATLTNQDFIGWLVTQVRLAILHQIYGARDDSDPSTWKTRVQWESYHPRSDLNLAKYFPEEATRLGTSKGRERRER